MKEIIGRVVGSWRVWLIPLLLVFVYLCFQLSQLSAYGVSWDEPLHRNWGKIFTLFWRSGDRRLLELMPGHGKYYGPLFFYLNFITSEYFYGNGYLSFVASNHVLTVVVSSAIVAVTFFLARSFGRLKVAFFALIFLLLYPPFLAHAHYNPKDIPLTAAVLVTAAVFLEGIRRNDSVFFFVSAILFGFAVAVKVNALLMAPVFGITYLAWLGQSMRASAWHTVLRKQISVLIVSTLLCGLGLYIFWPSAWGDWHLIKESIVFFTGEDFWPGKVLFFGVEYSGKDLPWFYIPFEYATSLPLLSLISFIVGFYVFIRAIVRSERRIEHLFFVLWVVFPLAYSMKPGLVRYDGMRQFFFTLPAVMIIASSGLVMLLDLLEKRSRKPHAKKVFLGIVLVSLVSQTVAVYPFGGSYRNELLQIAYQKNLDRSFQIEYWGPTYKQGMDWLNQNAVPHPIICVPTAGILVTWYPWRDDFTFECSTESNYVMFFTRYSEARAYEELKNPVFTIERMNSLLLAIYKVQ